MVAGIKLGSNNMDDIWVRAVATIGAAAALAIVVRGLNGSKGKSGKAVKSDDHDGPKAEKNPLAVPNYIEATKSNLANITKDELDKVGDLGKYMAFKSEYETRFAARPDVAEGELIRCTDWKLLTPEDYDRTCFHIEVDVSGTSMEHTVNGSEGKALSVYATNRPDDVQKFIKLMNINPHAIVSVEEICPQDEEGTVVLTTMEKLLMNYLDLFGKPTREVLKKLYPFAVDVQEKVAIAELTLDRKMEEFQDKQARAYTFADYILEYKSLNIPNDKFAELIPTIKQRVYSICSSTEYHPGKCQLLVVREDWQAKGGDTKWGFCSSFLTFARPGQFMVCHSTHSVMDMPKDPSIPIFMCGLGTGLAPFRAFVEQRKTQKDKGAKVGPMTLFFGGRYSKSEYYYKEEMQTFEREGLVKCCNAWSRDQKEKVYVHHKIHEEADHIWEHLGKESGRGCFFLCGSKQPEKDSYKAIHDIFQKYGKMSAEQATAKIEKLREAGRYVTEVY
jgi:sulfite reductase (NADPH) flavoprotein alpha-component